MPRTHIVSEIQERQDEILKEWVSYQSSADTFRRDLMKEQELREESRTFLDVFLEALQHNDDVFSPDWKPTKDFLTDLSRSRALKGFSPSETAMFVFSLKQPVFNSIRNGCGDDPQMLGREYGC